MKQPVGPERPELASVPLFSAFTPVADAVAAPVVGVRSAFALDELKRARDAHHPPAIADATPSEVDWVEASSLRGEASKRLTVRLEGLDGCSEAERRELGRAVIVEVVQAATERRFAERGVTWTPLAQSGLAKAVFDLMFGLGRLQPLVDRDDVEDIIVIGHDRVFLNLVDGSKEPGPAVAGSDAELVHLLQDLASRAVPPREFSEAHPELNLNLDGARLAASMSIVHRPSVVIRRHRLVDLDLDDLIDRGTITPVMASFLAAAVRARRSIVVSGEQGVGKTTLLRALCAEIGPDEVIGVFETERELGLETMTERHPLVFSWEARPGSSETGVDGRRAGEFTLSREMWLSHRYILSRHITGEVRGPEVAEMIMAMESGSGSMSTTHAVSAGMAMEKLASCAMQSGDFTRDAAVMKLARCIDLVVQMRTLLVGADGARRKQRVVDEIVAITPGENAVGYASTTVFRRTVHGTAMPHILPDHLRDLDAHGFNAFEFQSEARRDGDVA